MTDPTTPAAVPPAWYPDPAGSARQRWWDGTQWTDHYSDPYTTDAAVLKAPAGTKVYNVWIWLVVFVPYLTLPLLFTIDFGSMLGDLSDPTAATMAQLQFFTSPAYIGLVFAGLLTTGLTVLFSYLDWRWLVAAGVPKPFHWAWGFFSVAGYPVYAIGRAVVTRRRTGQGIAVMWVTIGMIVLTFIVATVWAVALVVTVMQQVSTLYPN